MRILIGTLVLAGLVLAGATGAAQAATTWYVQAGPTNGNGSSGNPFNTIQAGINAAANGDTVTVSTGSYTAINFNGKNITVQSTNPSSAAVVAATVINGLGAGPIATFSSGEGAGAVLQGFTITNGSYSEAAGYDGGTGGIYVLGASPTIRQNVIANNATTDDGAAILILNGSSPLIVSNTISGNTAGAWGGGIFAYTPSGGGLAAPRILSNCIASNSAAYSGGGLCPFESGYTLAMTASIVNNLILSNSAGDVGGGIFVGYQVQAIINNDTIVGNKAYSSAYGGFGLGDGGGIGFQVANVSGQVDSCIIYANTAVGNGQQVSLEDGSTASIDYSDLQGGQAAVYLANNPGQGTDTLTYGTHNLATDPLFGGAADYHLQSVTGRYNPATGTDSIHDAASSPGIAAGDPAFTFSGQPLPNGGRIEMGAYGNTAQASLAGQAISVAASLLHGWVYQNTATAKPRDTMTVSISSDPFGNTSYTVTASILSGSGQVTFVAGSSSSTVYVYGGLRTDGTTGTGSCQINVHVAAAPAGGTGDATVSMTVRKLGDIDGSGTVDATDRLSLNTRLNNLPTGLTDYYFDLTGEGYVTAADRVLLDKILNGLTP